ncbi:MAG: hypothetical protein WC933_01305 [Candidatus Paceibacterota bacterium]|jgi:hypothetical protein
MNSPEGFPSLDEAVEQLNAEEAKKNAQLSNMAKAVKSASETEIRGEPGEGSFIRLPREDEASIIERMKEGKSQEAIEVMFSPETSKEMSFNEAQRWCKEKGGRLPTIEELRYAYSNKVEGFDGKSYWSSSEGLDNDAQTLDFATGSEGLRPKTENIHVARAVDIAN